MFIVFLLLLGGVSVLLAYKERGCIFQVVAKRPNNGRHKIMSPCIFSLPSRNSSSGALMCYIEDEGEGIQIATTAKNSVAKPFYSSVLL